MRIAVGLDVSKGSSKVALAREDGSIIKKPFDVKHTRNEMTKLVSYLSDFDEEIRIVCEQTGNYSSTIVTFLSDHYFVSVVNPKVIKDAGSGKFHEGKTDKQDAVKIARFGIRFWNELMEYFEMDPKREELKLLNHQRELSVKEKTRLINSLIALSDKTFPGVNNLFSRTVKSDREKWVDFYREFWHCECISEDDYDHFRSRYKNFCERKGYRYLEKTAEKIYQTSQELVPSLQKDNDVRLIVQKSVKRVNNAIKDVDSYTNHLIRLARTMPEFDIVCSLEGVSELFAAQLIAEIGDVTRFKSRKALIAYAGTDPGANQSGNFDQKSNRSSKRGDALLRSTLFLIMENLLMHKPDDPVYHFLDKKRSEGKNYRVYMIAGSNKFLRIYYKRVGDFMKSYWASYKNGSH